MSSIGKRVSEVRKLKGLTQEQLAEQSTVSLRTIQRVENTEHTPRGNTLNLIYNVLEIDSNLFIKQTKKSLITYIGSLIVKGVFLVLLNLLLISIIGFLTLDSNANGNSRVGALLLSFFIPFFIVMLTQKMNALERLMKFGTGYFFYVFFLLFVQGFRDGFRARLGSGRVYSFA